MVEPELLHRLDEGSGADAEEVGGIGVEYPVQFAPWTIFVMNPTCASGLRSRSWTSLGASRSPRRGILFLFGKIATGTAQRRKNVRSKEMSQCRRAVRNRAACVSFDTFGSSVTWSSGRTEILELGDDLLIGLYRALEGAGLDMVDSLLYPGLGSRCDGRVVGQG